MFSTLATDKALTEILSAGIPMEIKELISLLTSFLALAARSACSLGFPAEELTATRVNVDFGALSKVALIAPKRFCS